MTSKRKFKNNSKKKTKKRLQAMNEAVNDE